MGLQPEWFGLDKWQPGVAGKAMVMSGPSALLWGVHTDPADPTRTSPHHYEVAKKIGVFNFLAFEIDADGTVHPPYSHTGDSPELQAVLACDPRLHAERGNDFTFGGTLEPRRGPSRAILAGSQGEWLPWGHLTLRTGSKLSVLLDRNVPLKTPGFQPDPTHHYRMIGEQGLQDLVQRGGVYPAPNAKQEYTAPYFMQGQPLQRYHNRQENDYFVSAPHNPDLFQTGENHYPYAKQPVTFEHGLRVYHYHAPTGDVRDVTHMFDPTQRQAANRDTDWGAFLDYVMKDHEPAKPKPVEPEPPIDYEARQREHFDRAISMDDNYCTEHVPTAFLSRLREFKRRPGEEHGSQDGYYEHLKSHIQQHGIGLPGVVEYDPDTGYAYLGEGNHRLSIAEDLGISHMPVRVMTRRINENHPTAIQITQPGQYVGERNYFPDTVKPSDIGIPTQQHIAAGPGYNPETSDWNFAEVKPWQPGTWGKGSVHYEGELHHWQTGGEGDHGPTHYQALEQLSHNGPHAQQEPRWANDPDKQEWSHFVIDPHGTVQPVMTSQWQNGGPADEYTAQAGHELARNIGGKYHDNDGFFFAKTAETYPDVPWKVVRSDFNPEHSYYQDTSWAFPDRSDQRVTVGHTPTHTIYVGEPGSHHSDIIMHHGLTNPADGRVDDPEDWSSAEQDTKSDLFYGMIDHRGGYSTWGPNHPGIPATLHQHGLLQQPDGSVEGDNFTFGSHPSYSGVIDSTTHKAAMPEVVDYSHVNDGEEDVIGTLGEGMNSFKQRQPVVYDANVGKIFVGPGHTSHYDLAHYAESQGHTTPRMRDAERWGEDGIYHGWLGSNPEYDPELDEDAQDYPEGSENTHRGLTYGWYTNPPTKHADVALMGHFKAKQHDDEGFTFGMVKQATSPIVLHGGQVYVGTPNDYHEDVYKRYGLKGGEAKHGLTYEHPERGNHIDWLGDVTTPEEEAQVNKATGKEWTHGGLNPYDDEEWAWAHSHGDGEGFTFGKVAGAVNHVGYEGTGAGTPFVYSHGDNTVFYANREAPNHENIMEYYHEHMLPGSQQSKGGVGHGWYDDAWYPHGPEHVLGEVAHHTGVDHSGFTFGKASAEEWPLPPTDVQHELQEQTQEPEPDKFVTTEEQHEQGKRRFGLPQPSVPSEGPREAAADPQWLQEYIAKHGPYFQHETPMRNLPKIMAEGLIPHDNGPGSLYSGALVPRTNHSYIRGLTDVTPREPNRYNAAVAVDLRKIDPSRLNADEDAFSDHRNQEDFGLPRAVQGEDPETGEEHVIDKATGNKYADWGEYADLHQLNHPAHTAHSVNWMQTLAVRGGVHPEALLPIEEAKNDLRDNYDHLFQNYETKIRQQEIPWTGEKPHAGLTQPAQHGVIDEHGAPVWARTANMIDPWQPGKHGKFLITQAGDLHHWRTGPYPGEYEYEPTDGYPAHADVSQYLGEIRHKAAGWIAPDGSLHSYGPHKDEVEDRAVREIPGTSKENSGFAFGRTAAAPTRPWQPGGEGKFFIAKDGTVHHWATEYGAPGHWNEMRNRGIPVEPGIPCGYIDAEGGLECHHGGEHGKDATVRAQASIPGTHVIDQDAHWGSLRQANGAKLYVDDERVAPDGYDHARNAEEAKRMLSEKEYEHASLDHDLSMVNGGEAYNPEAEDGHDLAHWMVENGHVPASVHIHSANPSGAQSMREVLEPHTQVTVGAHAASTRSATRMRTRHMTPEGDTDGVNLSLNPPPYAQANTRMQPSSFISPANPPTLHPVSGAYSSTLITLLTSSHSHASAPLTPRVNPGGVEAGQGPSHPHTALHAMDRGTGPSTPAYVGQGHALAHTHAHTGQDVKAHTLAGSPLAQPSVLVKDGYMLEHKIGHPAAGRSFESTLAEVPGEDDWRKWVYDGEKGAVGEPDEYHNEVWNKVPGYGSTGHNHTGIMNMGTGEYEVYGAGEHDDLEKDWIKADPGTHQWLLSQHPNAHQIEGYQNGYAFASVNGDPGTLAGESGTSFSRAEKFSEDVSNKLNVVHHDYDTDYDHDAEEGSGTVSQPIIYNQPSHTLHIGPDGGYHQDLLERGNFDRNFQTENYGRYMPNEEQITWYNKPDAAYNTIHDHLNAKDTDDDFTFGKVAAALEPWTPGSIGKGIVTPEGVAHTWNTTPEHDGLPSHSQGLQSIVGEDMPFRNALRRGYSFHQVYPNGQFEMLSGPPRHEEIMRAHLPQELRCEGCGEPTQHDSDGDYDCKHCGYNGGHELGDNGFVFGSIDDFDDPQGLLEPAPMKVVHHDDDGFWNNHDDGHDMVTHPVIYHGPSNELHVGPPGGYHADIIYGTEGNGMKDNKDLAYGGMDGVYHGRWNATHGTMHWYNSLYNPQKHQEIKNTLDANVDHHEQPPEDDWAFG